MPTCAACGEDNPAHARFCLRCGVMLAAAPSGRQTRKTVSVVFCDVVGSSGLGERLDPEPLRDVMTRYYERASIVLGRHGGRVAKFIGDAVMGVFGVPVVREDDALRAVRAAAELRSGLTELNAELLRDHGVQLDLRIGVNTGVVVIGDAVSGQDIALGDVVNVAARLEQIANPGEVLLGDVTYRLVRDAVTVELLPPLALKGKGVAVEAWRLIAVRPGAAGHARRLDTPVVGREREISLLLQAWDRTVEERRAHLVTLLGAAGVGKSRMVHELLTRVRGRATVLRGHCPDYGEGMTYRPLAEVVHAALGAAPGEGPAELRRRLAALFPSGEKARAVADQLAVLLGDADPGADVGDLHEGLRQLLGALAARQPVVVVIDDLQWADGALLDLIEHLTVWLQDTPVLLCCLARPDLLDLRPGWGGGKVNATTLLLEPLTDEQSRALVANLLDGGEGADDIRQRLIEAAEGNPLYLEELVGMLIDDGLLAQADGRWTSTADLSRVSVPPTIAALLAARLDGLSAGERTVLERASVVGNVFDHASVTALTPPEERPALTGHLLDLVRKELIRPDPSTLLGESALRFRHLLLRDAAYNSLSKRERADLHERFADWLEQTPGERGPDVEELVGYHLEQSCRLRTGLGPLDERTLELARRASEHLAAAGQRAFGRRDMSAAGNLLSRAVALVPLASPAALALLPDLAAALVELGEFRRAEAALTQAVAGAERTGDRRLLASALRVRAVLQRHQGAPAPADSGVAAVAAGGLGEPPVPARGGGAGVAEGWTLMADVSWLPPPPRVPAPAAPAGGSGLPQEGADPAAVDSFAMTTVLGPVPVREAVDRYGGALDADVNPTRAVRVLSALAGLVALEGGFDDARGHLDRARDILEQRGLRVRAVALVYLAGFVELLADEPARAEELLERGRAECERMGERRVLAHLVSLLAHAVYAQGRYVEAVQLGEAGAQGSTGDEVAGVIARAARAKALARLAMGDEARAVAHEAVAAAPAELPVVRAAALLDLADVLEAIGEPQAATAAAQEALTLYRRKGATVPAARAETLLRRLTPPPAPPP